MARNLAKLIAATGALIGGYAKGKSLYDEAQAREEERQWRREDRAREEAIRQAAAETLGRAGSEYVRPEDASGVLGPQQQEMMRQDIETFGPDAGKAFIDSATYASPQLAAAAAGIKPTIYGRSQATGDFIRRLYQIDPAKASQMEVTQLQIGDLQDKSQRRNSLKEVDLAVGQWANQAAPKDEQGRPVMTDDFMVNLGKKRVFELANRGLFDEAMQSANEAMQYATRKIQAEQAARQAAVRDAVAAAAMGDYSKALETYNQYVPDGSKATRVVQNKDGSFTVERVSAVDGTPLPPGRFKDSDHFISSLRMLEDSGALASYIDRTFRHDIESRKLALDERREGRLSAESRDKRDAERAKADAAAALFKELNPNATVAQIEAVRRGVITAVPKDEGYKTEFNEVANALGQPATDKKGRPIMDPVTGRQLINRDHAAEAAFFNWMQKSGIKDTNKALQLYLANRSGAGRPSEAEAIEQAKAAIARGADKEAVNARLRQWGYREIR